MGDRGFEWDPEKAELLVRELRPNVRDEIMKKASEREPDLDMAPEYDFSKGVRGKYAKRFPPGSKIVVIAPDVARDFGTQHGVNNALRRLAKAEREVLAVKRELQQLKKSLRARGAVRVTKRAKHPAQVKGNRG